MATTAALLQIQVAAETTKATLALKKLDRQLTGIDKTTATATTRTSNLGKASSKAGSMLKTAAISAGSAALAYLSISQAKSAVTVTQDLAKTTAGLSRNLGLSSKQASRWGTVAKARDIDAKALTMSFTTLSRRITDMSKGSESAVDSFKDIGVTQKEMKQTGGDFNKQLLLVADSFGAAEGGAVRQQAAQKLLGRGYQTLLPMFAEGSKSLKEQQAWADKYGTTLTDKTVASQMELVNAQRESKVAMLGLQVSFTEALTPALKEANQQFQKIAQIIGSDKLTNAEKFQKVGKIVEGWASGALDAFVAILPTMVEKAATAAPRIAGAFVEGFAKAPIWGQLLLGGFLLTKMGGLASFATLGTRAGGAFGKAFGIAGAAIGGFIFGKEVVAPALKSNFAEELGERFNLVQGDAEKVVKFMHNNPGLGIPESIELALNPMGKALHAVADMEFGWTRHMRQIGDISKKELDRIGDLLREKPKKGVAALDEAMSDMNVSIRQAMNRGEIDTRRAMKLTHSNLVDQLGLYGIESASAQKILKAKKGDTSGYQRGGPIDQGRPSGDSVPAMLERGEYVLNRNAVSAVGKDSLDRLNFGSAKRFAAGGMAGLQPGISRLAKWANQRYGLNISSGFRSGTGSLHNIGAAVDLVPPGMAATKGIFGAFKNQLAELFYDPWGGWNDGQMIGAIGDHLDHIHAAILGAGAKAGIGRAKIKLPRFKATAAMFEPGAAGLNNSARGLEKIMGRRAAAATASAGHGNIGNISGPLQEIARRMVTGRWGAAQWPPFNDLVNRESGWDPTAVNPSSGAAGLAQALPPSKYPPGAWPYRGQRSAVKQLQWMIQYIAGRYGTPAGAIDWHNAHNWYQQGGMVGMQAGGESPYAPKGRFGRAHMRLAQLPGMKKRMQKLAKRIARTDERIQIQQTLAGYPTSPGGSELAGSEKDRQLGLYGTLLNQLMEQRKTAQQGFRTSKHFKKNPAFFRDALVELQGLTGGAGRLLDTKTALAELKATPPAGTGGISIDDLLRIREGATLGLLGGLGNGLAAGGAAPSPSAGPEVNINYANGMEWLRDFVSVQVDGRDRRTNIRSLAGVRR